MVVVVVGYTLAPNIKWPAIPWPTLQWTNLLNTLYAPEDWAPAYVLRGVVTHVRDGDTFEVEGVPVRIAALDCAELGTSWGAIAKQRMSELAYGRSVECVLEGRMSYDREVGDCRLAGGPDVAEVLISEGVCGRWR